MYLIFLMYALLASTFAFGKLLIGLIPPIFLISLRMIIAGTMLLVFSYVFDQKQSIKSSDWWLFCTVILFHILIPFTTEYIALQSISPSNACLLYNLSPFFSALCSYIIFQEKMTLKKWIGFCIGIIGILFYLQSQCCFDISFSWPNVLMLISVMTSSIGWIFFRVLVKNRNYPSIMINGLSMFISGFIALPISRFFEGSVIVNLSHIPQIIALVGATILITNIIFYNLYGYLLKYYTATFLSFVGFVTPLFAAFFEWIFIGTTVPHEFFLTIAIVGAGIYIFYQEELKQGYIIQ